MRSILNLTSPKDWLYRYVDKDPGLGGDRSDPDFREMDSHSWKNVADFVSRSMDAWKGITLRSGVIFDLWYIKWSHLLEPKFPVELEIPINELRKEFLVEIL